MSIGSKETQEQQKLELEEILREIEEDNREMIMAFATYMSLRSDILVPANVEYQVDKYLTQIKEKA